MLLETVWDAKTAPKFGSQTTSINPKPNNIGSRNGDLIECVSHTTAGAVSIEGDYHYCKTLRRRATSSRG